MQFYLRINNSFPPPPSQLKTPDLTLFFRKGGTKISLTMDTMDTMHGFYIQYGRQNNSTHFRSGEFVEPVGSNKDHFMVEFYFLSAKKWLK